MEEKDGKIEKKIAKWSDLEQLMLRKNLLDEKYAEIDKKAMKLGSKTLKMKKKYGDI